MRIINPLNSEGLFPLQNPIINAPTFGSQFEYFLWGDRVRVFQRLEFPQTVNGVSDRQIWYQVGFVNDTVARGWIPARYEGLNYVEGISADGTQNGCSAFSTITIPTTLTFNYDRRAAAHYAIEHSYDTAINHGVLQGQGRVTQRLANQSGLRYAYFRYSGIGQQQFVTGSAVFISESLWMGGMPMTVGNSASCTSPVSLTDAGWRYCFNAPTATPSYGDASNPFDTHEDLYDYWSTGNINTVLGISNRGRQILMPGSIAGAVINSSSTQYIWGGDGGLDNVFNHDLWPALREINLGSENIPNAQALSTRIVSLLTNPQGQSNPLLQMGDYIFITTNPRHGLFVVGWQSARECVDALSGYGTPGMERRNWQREDFAESSAMAALFNISNPVPYVVDFTAPYVNNPTPRPFYCTRHVDDFSSPDPNQPGFFSAHNWQFFTMPDTVILSPNSIYVDVSWGW